MTKVGIVTDSTCDLEPADLEKLGVELVPLKVLFADGSSHLDWVEMRPAEFYEKLRVQTELPKTSQPSPADFLSVYRRLAAEGCEGIVSIHLTAALSGTFQSATLAAEDSPVPVRALDTKKVSQALGLVVKAACEARAAGLDTDAVAARAEEVASNMRLFFVLDTLDYLVKGGRAGKAQGLAASLLNIKPVLDMNADGIIEPFKKVKGRKKAIAELAAHVAEDARENGRMRAAILHACTANCGADLVDELTAAGADIELEGIGLVGSVVGNYAGPDALGIAYYPEG
jgi:DegV family protein with EDD domain